MTIESRYALSSSLERGRFGAMYRAVDLRRAASGDRVDDVVVWVLPPEFAQHGPARAAFLRDLERVRELTHPNIAQVLDIGQEGERLFVATEFSDGDCLRNVLEALGSERLELREADSVLEDIGSALAYAHERGIVHGDVRPENIIVTGDHRIKVANFMLASLARSTPFAPALLDDTRALAALAHELYCGVPPDPNTRARSFERLPRQRRKAIEIALTASNDRPLSVTDFLAHAGLARDGCRLSPRRRVAPPRRFSPWQIALTFGGLAAIGLALQVGVDGTRRQPVLGAPSASVRTGDETTEPAGTAARDETRNPTPPQEAVPLGTAAHVTTRATSAIQLIETPARAETVAVESKATAAPAPAAPTAAVAAPTGGRSTGSAERWTLSAHSVTVYEDQGIAAIDILRTADVNRSLDVIWWTSDGTAHAEDDYASFGARVESFAPGETERTLHIPLVSDALAEQPETFFVHVRADRRPGHGETKATAEIQIIDDDF